MRDAVALVHELSQKNIKLSADGGRLKINAPKGALSAALRARLVDHKQAVLDYLEILDRDRSRLCPRPRTGAIPLSFAQQRIWFLCASPEQSAAYNLPTLLELRGALDPTGLGSSLDRVAARHQILRTRFPKEGSGVVQRIEPGFRTPVTLIDLSGLEPTRADELGRDLSEADAGLAFDLANGPLMRVYLFRKRTRHHLLLVNLHHIVSDAWSADILVRETAYFYRAELRRSIGDGTNAPPELSVQYADYALWQHDEFGQKRLQKQLRYWQDLLLNAPVKTDLPTDRDRPELLGFRGAVHGFTIAADGCADYSDRQASVSGFMYFQALFAVLIGRYSGQSDLVIGSPTTTRDDLALEPLIGFFVNTLAFRFDLSDDPDWRKLLERVRRLNLEAAAHKHAPFDQVVQLLKPVRNPSHHPIFQIMFGFERRVEARLNLPGLETVPVASPNPSAKFDLSLSVSESETGVSGQFEYNTDLFREETVRRLAAHFVNLRRTVAARPELRISQYVFLSENERKQILCDWSQTGKTHQTGDSLFERFADRAHAHPDRIALDDASNLNGMIAYKNLWRSSARLVELMRGRGVGPEDRVVVLGSRSPGVVTATLAVLGLGAVYVPLDPELPPARLALFLEKVRAKLVMIIGEAADRSMSAIRLDRWGRPRDLATPTSTCTHWPNHPPQSAAYLFFTSGSTGEPKGVLVSIRAMHNRINWAQSAYALGGSDRFLQTAAPGFDIALWEMVAPLIAGARLVLPPPAAQREPNVLAALMRDRAVTAVHFVPSLLAMMLREPDFIANGATLHVFCGGDRLSPDIARSLLNRTDAALHHFYGPTEAAINVTAETLVRDSDLSRIALGRPIDNVALFVLDPSLAPVPPGIVAELYIGGEAPGRGYLNRPDLTAESFIPNPFLAESPESGDRLYRTGDFVRFRDDGRIEFEGRRDRQLKIHGHRIEPAEIARVLCGHAGIAEAVVTVHEARTPSAGKTPRLYAHAVPAASDLIEIWPSIAEFFIYDDAAYDLMATDPFRARAYRDVFRERVAGKIVVDIGTGPLAVLARLCVEAGAAKVYAVEYLESTYRKAVQTVAGLGLSDRITVIHGDARSCALPERADLCVSEIVGPIGGAEGAAVIINAARRLLKDPSQMFPRRARTHIAAISLPENRFSPGFPELAARYAEEIFRQNGAPFDFRFCLRHFRKDLFLSERGLFEDLDFTRELDCESRHEIRLPIKRSAICHGFLVWLELFIDERRSIDIIDQSKSWMPVFFPVWPDGLNVAVGDELRAEVVRTLAENGLNPDFTVAGVLVRQDGPDQRFYYQSRHDRNPFRQNKFSMNLFSPDGAPVRTRERLSESLSLFARDRLPAHMLPVIQLIDRLPLDVNGKVDPNALPDPARSKPESRFVPARNDTETTLARLWAETLGLPRVGIHDNFFQLGGDSILSIQIAARARQLGVSFTTKQLFQRQTVAALASVVTRLAAPSQAVAAITGVIPLTPIQRRFFETPGPGDHFNQSVMLRLKREIEPAKLQIALQRLTERYDALLCVSHATAMASQSRGSSRIAVRPWMFTISGDGPTPN